MNTEPVVTKDELIAMLTHENVELHKKIHEEHERRLHAEEMVRAWQAKFPRWDCGIPAWDSWAAVEEGRKNRSRKTS